MKEGYLQLKVHELEEKIRLESKKFDATIESHKKFFESGKKYLTSLLEKAEPIINASENISFHEKSIDFFIKTKTAENSEKIRKEVFHWLDTNVGDVQKKFAKLLIDNDNKHKKNFGIMMEFINFRLDFLISTLNRKLGWKLNPIKIKDDEVLKKIIKRGLKNALP